MNEYLVAYGVPVLMFLIALILKNKVLSRICNKAGVVVSTFLVGKLGKNLADAVEMTIVAATEGFIKGLRKDNGEKEVAKKKIENMKSRSELD